MNFQIEHKLKVLKGPYDILLVFLRESYFFGKVVSTPVRVFSLLPSSDTAAINALRFSLASAGRFLRLRVITYGVRYPLAFDAVTVSETLCTLTRYIGKY